MRYIFTCIILMLFSFSKAQIVNLEWAKQFKGSRNDIGNSIAVDASGNVYTVGIFQGTVDFDPGTGVFNLTSSGTEAFVTKIDASGNFIWAKKISAIDASYIGVDNLGNIIITGSFSGNVDFDPNSGVYNLSSSGIDMYVVKLNGSGNLLWAIKIGDNGNDYGIAATIDVSGNVYFTGQFQGTVDFDPGVGIYNLTSTASSNMCIVKLNSSGNLILAKNISSYATDIAVDISGNICLTGYFNGTIDFDPGPATYNLTSNYDIFILKLNPSGNFLWAKSIGGNYTDEGNSIAIDASGNVVVAGDFYYTVDFDPGPGVFDLINFGSHDIFVLKLDASGNFVWARNMGGSNVDMASSVAIDPSGNVYTTGLFLFTGDFDPGPGIFNLTSTANKQDIFISKLDPSGNFKWALQLGGTTFDWGKSIVTDGAHNVYVTGIFGETGDFDPGPSVLNFTSAGDNDVFVIKLSQVILPRPFTTLVSSLNPSTSGQTITFTANVLAPVSSPTGTVSFFDGTTLLGTASLTANTGSFSSSASFSISTLAVGSHNITAVYNGDMMYNSSTSTVLVQVVNVAMTNTLLISSLNPSAVGQNVTFTATVSGAQGIPPGPVAFYDGSTLLGTATLNANSATFSTSLLNAGSHDITAIYAGNANYIGSTSPVLIQVVNIPVVSTTISLSSSMNPSIVGQGVTFTATVSAVSGTPTGTVTFYDGATVLGIGSINGNTASLNNTSLSAGSHNITAVYNGAAYFSSSISPVLTQVINYLPGSMPTSTSLISSGNFTAVMQNVNFTATVTASSGIPTGTVSFFDGSTLLATKAISANTATYSTSSLITGWHTITAKYNGDINYLTSSSSISHTVTTIALGKLFHLYPNPITGNSISFELNMQQGKYYLTFATTLGQSLLITTVDHPGGAYIHTIRIPQNISSGIYLIKLTGRGVDINRKVIKNQ